LLHTFQVVSAKAYVSALVAVACAGVLIWAALAPNGDTILLWFGSVAAAITVVMVFVLQHTQSRQQDALQHKLDEVLHALPLADDRLIHLESAPESELLAVEVRHAALRDDAVGD
jgi:low affinity Fe/Cu permease